ncbi:MAG: DUF6404 family protein [Pseudomonadota bacterium]
MTNSQRDYDRKFEAALQEMHEKGLAQSIPLPVLFLRKLGNQPRLPHYDRFWRAALVQGGFFGPLFGSFMYVLVWRDDGMTPAAAIFLTVLSVVLFGLTMALYYQWVKSRHKLTEWDTL